MSDALSNERDRVVPLESVPRPSGDEPAPFIAGTERQLALAYRIGQSDLATYGASFDEEAPFCVLLFPQPASHAHTNEEFGLHPLTANGLIEHCVHEVLNSASVATPSDADPSAMTERHFVITFRDSTFECIAADCVVAGVYGSGDVAAREAVMLCQ
jgi:hypothetical protein